MTLQVSVRNEVWEYSGVLYMRSVLLDPDEGEEECTWYRETAGGRMKVIDTIDELLKVEVAYFARNYG